MMKRLIAFALMLTMVAPVGAAAQQVPPDVWRGFIEKIDPGTELNVRMRDGKRFRAVVVDTRPDAVLLQPKTRVTVPVQVVPYDAIASLERRQAGGGVSAAKAAAIGVATGAGAFLAILAILMATID